jgi:D-alanyl-D-alanine carboxypeptidase
MQNIVRAAENPPSASADGVVLMDASTGTVLYSKNPDSAYPPASTTKIMTALLTFEKTKLTDQVIVGKNPTFADGSAVGIREGEIFTVKDLLYGLLLESGNDCAEAIAEHISGSKEKFAELMNNRAKELGCTNTNFVNPSGLFNKEHKTSALDLALIMRELIKYPEYKVIATSPFYKIEPTNKCNTVRYTNNKNKLVLSGSSFYKDCIGGKTGYTIESQHSYVTAAERNGQRLIVTFIHDSKKTYFEDAVDLFNYGYKNFELKRLFAKGDEVYNYPLDENTSIPLLAYEDFYYVAEKNSSDEPKLSVANKDLKTLSFYRGDKISNALITYKDKNLGSLILASGIDHEINPVTTFAGNGSVYLAKSFKAFVNILIIIILLFVFLLIIRFINKNRRKRRRLKFILSRYKNSKNM